MDNMEQFVDNSTLKKKQTKNDDAKEISED